MQRSRRVSIQHIFSKRCFSFIDKVKAFLKEPGYKESERKFAGAPPTIDEIFTRASGSQLNNMKLGGFSGFLGKIVLKTVLGKMNGFAKQNQAVIHDIVFNAAQMLEMDPRVVAVFGPMVQINSGFLDSEEGKHGTVLQGLTKVTVNGITRSEFQLVCVITGVGTSLDSGHKVARGRTTIHATLIGDKIELTKLNVDTGTGQIDVLHDYESRRKGDNLGTHRVRGSTTIDVKGRDP